MILLRRCSYWRHFVSEAYNNRRRCFYRNDFDARPDERATDTDISVPVHLSTRWPIVINKTIESVVGRRRHGHGPLPSPSTSLAPKAPARSPKIDSSENHRSTSSPPLPTAHINRSSKRRAIIVTTAQSVAATRNPLNLLVIYRFSQKQNKGTGSVPVVC